ncbi:hypothetical protein DY000_02045969 [Brassica cretica]|uniref:Uncharacterized protein n=1 Tax=Brassica cretica TaxID=69181 RepID=A0ABQ7F105_BRACR|nr:hypothetical protein DY000_02045969 [Brassica cretica]
MCFDANEDPSSKLREFALIPNEGTIGVKNGYDGITTRKSSEIVFPKETVKRKINQVRGKARSLRSNRARAKARSLRSDRALVPLGRYVATELEPKLGRYSKAFLILAQTFATREQLQHATSSSFATASDSSRPTIKVFLIKQQRTLRPDRSDLIHSSSRCVRVQLAAQLLWWSDSTII